MLAEKPSLYLLNVLVQLELRWSGSCPAVLYTYAERLARLDFKEGS